MKKAPEKWTHVEELFNAALELEPAARESFLAEACAGDEELRREVESLLAYEDKTAGFIQKPALEVAADALAADARETGLPTSPRPRARSRGRSRSGCARN
jgi:serine/threonine-protein kinase